MDGSGSVYIADSGNKRVLKVAWTGSAYGTQSTVSIGIGEKCYVGVAVDGGGNVSIADSEGQVAKWTWLIRRRCLFRSLPGSVRSIAAMAR